MKNESIREVLGSIEESITPFHAVEIIKKKLIDEGFKEVTEDKLGFSNIYNGSKNFIIRDGSSIIAFTVGKNYDEDKYDGFNIVVTHTDSPCFKIKQNPEIKTEDNITKLNVEGYGSGIWHTWLDRKLGIAGRAITKENGKIVPRLVKLEDNIIIPSLAIHMQRDINDGKKFNIQEELLPIIGKNFNIINALEDKFKGIDGFERVYDYDLYVHSNEKAFISGDIFSSPRIDNLVSTFSAIEAICSEEITESHSVNIVAAFDNEEIGSSTYAGAGSTFLKEVVKKIACSLAHDGISKIFNNSLIISLDSAHASHPNYYSKSDPTNKVHINEGIVIKYHANKRYGTDAISAAIIKDICLEGKIPVQTFFNRSDMASGGTIGTLLFKSLGIRTVDIGIPQLAMHSIIETAGLKDIDYLIKFLNRFFLTKIESEGTSITLN